MFNLGQNPYFSNKPESRNCLVTSPFRSSDSALRELPKSTAAPRLCIDRPAFATPGPFKLAWWSTVLNAEVMGSLDLNCSEYSFAIPNIFSLISGNKLLIPSFDDPPNLATREKSKSLSAVGHLIPLLSYKYLTAKFLLSGGTDLDISPQVSLSSASLRDFFNSKDLAFSFSNSEFKSLILESLSIDSELSDLSSSKALILASSSDIFLLESFSSFGIHILSWSFSFCLLIIKSDICFCFSSRASSGALSFLNRSNSEYLIANSEPYTLDMSL